MKTETKELIFRVDDNKPDNFIMFKNVEITSFSISGKPGQPYDISAEITAEEVTPAEVYKIFKDGRHKVEYIKIFKSGLDDDELHEVTYDEFMDEVMIDEL